MNKFILNFIYNRKLKFLRKSIDKYNHDLTIFQKITITERFNKIFNSISQIKDLTNLVQEIENIIILINEHNNKINLLENSFSNILLEFPINNILNNILSINKEKLSEIYNVIVDIKKYNFPTKHQFKVEFNVYSSNLIEIYENYDLVYNQKKVINKSISNFNNLPNRYLDYYFFEKKVAECSTLLEEIKGDYKLFFPLPSFDYDVIESHNINFINNNLNDPLFDNINNKSLDNDQRKAVLCDEVSNLIIAGAGSGKTLTICGKVKYLLENNLANENEILLLSYSKASSIDLGKKIAKISDNLRVETFHALGLSILNKSKGFKQTIDEQLKNHINNYFTKELKNDKEQMINIFNYFTFYLRSSSNTTKKYKDDGELFKDLKSQNYTTLKDQLYNLNTNSFKKETLKKEYVKSNQELIIANYLFINGINYEYEKKFEYDTATLEKRQYTPDFYLTDYNIYIEHYGIDKDGNTPQYNENDSKNYLEGIKWKRDIHKEHNTVCIETYSWEFDDGTIFDTLKQKLIAQNVEFKPISEENIFNALNNILLGKNFTSFQNLMMTFLSLYKSQYDSSDGFNELSNRLKQNNYETNRTLLFLNIARKIYIYYTDKLKKEEKIDFDDMILQAIRLLDELNEYKYKYIIVDEFQDISISRTKFLQKLIAHGQSKLFAVGDDWQAIYRFAGCDINVFLNFNEVFPHAKINYITSTHRNSQELQDIMEPFITANPSQYKKNIKSNLHQENPIRIYYYTSNPISVLNTILKEIKTIKNNASVLILGRNKRDIETYLYEEIKLINGSTINHKQFPTLDLSYNTVHGSKGLESDFTILISGNDAENGFPNKMEDDPILELLLGKQNTYLFAEERRLFYVSITRTRSISFIISEANSPSIFVKEIEKNCFIFNNEPINKNQNNYLCPWCKSGYLLIRKNNEQNFYGCTNFPYCKYTNNNLKSVETNIKCPKCGDFLTMRNGRFGYFKGCHNYPICDFTEKI